ncbi:hypothetical protein ACLI4Z_04200 [Natrialbaceae archaeon A-arb3/5]
MDDRGVSELVGYTIIFGVALLTLSSVLLLGTSGLTDSRDVAQTTNAETAFEILAENIDDHATDRAVGRATEIRVADADLYFGAEENYTVTADETMYRPVHTDPIVYELHSGERIVYSNGALFRENSHGSRMISEPQFRINESRAMLHPIEIAGADRHLSVAGSRPVLIRTEQRTPRLYQNTTSESYELSIEITTDENRAGAWERYLNDESGDETFCSVDDLPDGNALVTCDGYETDEIHMPVTRLNAEFS